MPTLYITTPPEGVSAMTKHHNVPALLEAMGMTHHEFIERDTNLLDIETKLQAIDEMCITALRDQVNRYSYTFKRKKDCDEWAVTFFRDGEPMGGASLPDTCTAADAMTEGENWVAQGTSLDREELEATEADIIRRAAYIELVKARRFEVQADLDREMGNGGDGCYHFFGDINEEGHMHVCTHEEARRLPAALLDALFDRARQLQEVMHVAEALETLKRVQLRMSTAGQDVVAVRLDGGKSAALVTGPQGDGLHDALSGTEVLHTRDFSLHPYLPLDTLAKQKAARAYVNRTLQAKLPALKAKLQAGAIQASDAVEAAVAHATGVSSKDAAEVWWAALSEEERASWLRLSPESAPPVRHD